MRRIFLLYGLLIPGIVVVAQSRQGIISVRQVERIEKILSADDMRGRAIFTAGIEKAADFINGEFKAAGLRTWNGSANYRQPFTMLKSRLIAVSGKFDGLSLDPGKIQAFSSQTSLMLNQDSGYAKAHIQAGDSFNSVALKYIRSNKNYLVLVDTGFAKNFERLSRYKRQQFKSPGNIVFVLTDTDPREYSIAVQQEITESDLANLVGILPGRSRKDKYVVFSAHYDHLGVAASNGQSDSIYNGANDDASGVTAVIMLAKYFAKLRNNQCTLVFAAFTAEEAGGFGSQYFSRQFDPDKVVAMFNIEMIGTQSKWGINSAYITGYEKSDMGSILQKNLAKSQFRFYPDPYPQENLFYRSDNATLARLRVPAHTISTSKMDSEKQYHTVGDEIGTLDLKNMTEIIKAIARSATSIVEGKDEPTRIDEKKLK